MAVAVGRLGTLFKLQKYIVALLFLSFLCGMVLGITLVTDSEFPNGLFGRSNKAERATKDTSQVAQNPIGLGDIGSKRSGQLDKIKAKHDNMVQGKEDRIEHSKTPLPRVRNPFKSAKGNATAGYGKRNPSAMKRETGDEGAEALDVVNGKKFPKPNYNLHAFYYPWYGNPKHDGEYLHWNHLYLSHWDKNEAKKWPHGAHKPPDDIGAQYYPALGPYSSKSIEVMEKHMEQIRSAGIGVLAVSWYPPDQADEQGKAWDGFMSTLMDVANRYDIKICFHIEPYQGRNSHSMLRNIKYIHDTYGQHPAYYKRKHRRGKLPLFYIYDSYLVKKEEWGTIFRPDSRKTVRNTAYDAIFLGLVVNEPHKSEVLAAGFDGYYTYFASDGFTHGSSTRNWAPLAQYANSHDALFVPSVGPGYNDVRVRPWNAANTKDREHGGYYEQSFKAALAVHPPIISITSFNEWHEGTQIEMAVPQQYKNFKYSDYLPQESDYYLSITRKFSLKYRKQQSGRL